MLALPDLSVAIEKLYDAALLGDGWGAALSMLARAGASRGVVIMHNRNRKIVAAVSNVEIRQEVEAYLAGKSPLNSRQTRVSHDFDPGFRIDQDDYGSRDISADAYYQEYLRPVGLGWHANARLQMENADEVAIGFKRELDRGPYDEPDKRVLDQILPHLRTIARIAECVFDAEARGAAFTLHKRGRPVVEVDSWGRVRRLHGELDSVRGPLVVKAGRLCSLEAAAQRKLDALIGRAARHPRQQGAIVLHDALGDRFILQVLPLIGRTRDVFPASSALGVLIPQPAREAVAFNRDAAIELFDLTPREAQVIGLLCQGQSLSEIATALRVVPDTVRYHLKSVFEKTGVNRQVEVVALLAQLTL